MPRPTRSPFDRLSIADGNTFHLTSTIKDACIGHWSCTLWIAGMFETCFWFQIVRENCMAEEIGMEITEVTGEYKDGVYWIDSSGILNFDSFHGGIYFGSYVLFCHFRVEDSAWSSEVRRKVALKYLIMEKLWSLAYMHAHAHTRTRSICKGMAKRIIHIYFRFSKHNRTYIFWHYCR